MKFICSKAFTGSRARESLLIAVFDNTSVKLHWTDKPYKWHINDGQEVFAVMDGTVDMNDRENGVVKSRTLHAGDIFYASTGTEHVACPQGTARVLVIEKAGVPFFHLVPLCGKSVTNRTAHGSRYEPDRVKRNQQYGAYR